MNTSPAVTVCIVPSARRRTKRPLSSMVSNWPVSSPSARRHANGLAEARGAREPVGADRGKARAAVPLRQAGGHRGRQRRKQALGRGADAGRGKIGRRKFGPGRMMHAVDADADHDRRPLALDQDAGELVAVDQEVVRPFQREPRRRGPECARSSGVVQRQRRDERQFRQALRRRRIGEEQAGVEIARLGHPGAAAPAAARGLAARGDPQRAALARARQPQRLPRWSSRSCRG